MLQTSGCGGQNQADGMMVVKGIGEREKSSFHHNIGEGERASGERIFVCIKGKENFQLKRRNEISLCVCVCL